MNGTPRLRSAYPSTPPTAQRRQNVDTSLGSSRSKNVATPVPDMPTAQSPRDHTGPLIPTDILDAPTQRLYAFAFYTILFSWRLYDFYNLTVDEVTSGEVDSFWYFIKWVAIDGVFLFGLPALQIPWLEWSTVTVLVIFLSHAVLDAMLMFRIGLPIQAWFISFIALIFDSELAIAEHKVKPGPILHNASLILGKQIINILPEGSALLNPDKESFCLNTTIHQLEIPIQINQTEPILIELLRIDIDTMQNETVTISARETKSILNKAKKSMRIVDPASPVVLRYPVKKTGIYLLQKVVDKSKLEVRPRASSLVVATCPQARVRPTGENRCRNDLSNIALEIEGTPPLRIKYRLIVNGVSREASEFQSLQPDDFVSPLNRHSSQALIQIGREDVSWARSHTITVPLSESLTSSGKWTYSIEEVEDALGNRISYTTLEEEDRPKPKTAGLQQSFIVHERPNVDLQGCNSQNPLQVPKGQVARLPIKYGSTGKGSILTVAHTIEYLFTPEADLLPDGNHSPNAELKKQSMKSIREQPLIQDSGLYTLKSISSEFCEGEVLEPASCLLQNPPEPVLTLSSEPIVDKCAGRPIGLRVQMNLIGSPPFSIRYKQRKNGGTPQNFYETVNTLRGQINLTPPEAGHYKYVFDEIQDRVYSKRPLRNHELEQDVKPSASAHFVEPGERKQACIDDSVEFDVRLLGEGPWTLDYELVHSGKRTKHSAKVDNEHHTITTPKLNSGGEYTVSLASVTDGMGCKEYLDEAVKVNVRHERPKAYFGQLEGKQSVLTLEGKPVELPIRFTGTGPWELEFENLNSNDVRTLRGVRKANDMVKVNHRGTYKLLSVSDSICPGFIDDKANHFKVDWISRPQISIAQSATTTFEDGRYIKEAVCEGDEDGFDVSLSGAPPFEVSYEQQFKVKQGNRTPLSLAKKDIKTSAGSTSIRSETSQAGFYEYKFHKLADYNYDHDPKRFQSLIVQQTVYSRPDARFTNPGKTYSYCSREADGEEVIPVTFTGVAPFYLEIEIKHHGTPRPETVSFKNIQSNNYDLRIPHRLLHLGHSNISIRKIRDARNCVRKPLPTTPRVQISVHDAPTATPLEDRTDFCVGERLGFALGGQVPFTVFYTFNGHDTKASNSGTSFRRLAEIPGTFSITGLRDSASDCHFSTNLTKIIHPIPSVRLSRGQVVEVDIHEGGESELLFEFEGSPPFEFTYTRSTNARKGKKSRVLEMKTEQSWERSMRVRVAEEGTYEVVSIKDRWCSFAKTPEGGVAGAGKGDKLLTY